MHNTWAEDPRAERRITRATCIMLPHFLWACGPTVSTGWCRMVQGPAPLGFHGCECGEGLVFSWLQIRKMVWQRRKLTGNWKLRHDTEKHFGNKRFGCEELRRKQTQILNKTCRKCDIFKNRRWFFLCPIRRNKCYEAPITRGQCAIRLSSGCSCCKIQLI